MRLASPRTRSWQFAVWCVLLMVVWSLAACQPIQPVTPESGSAVTPQIPEVMIEINEGEVNIPADFPGGIVSVTVQNYTATPLDVGFSRLREGTTVAEIEELGNDVMGNLVALLQKASFMLSFNPVPAGESKEAIIDFKTGEFIIDASEHTEEEPVAGTPRFYGAFTASEIVGTMEPQADVTVEMLDFSFTMPDEVPAGELLWQFNNQGQQWHMALFVKPNPGMSIEEVIEAARAAEGEPSGPPPFEFVEDAGVPPISEGERAWVKFELQPGEYLVLCPIPDLAAMVAGQQPTSHFDHGMYRALTVK